MYIMFYLI
ncbi:hypothetical protein YPPY58_3605, partial [Yersinia pestis PY-58]